jgi:fructose-bisphosphate aldolase, class II
VTSNDIMRRALCSGKVIPSFSISYLPMVEPIVRACRDANSLGQIAVARADWVRFGVGSIKAVRDEYRRCNGPEFVTLHLDHIPVVEDGEQIDYESIIGEAICLGFGSVMVDGSMLPLAENIAATQAIVQRAHASNVAVEGELGAVAGYMGLTMSYEELFRSRQGFTDVDQSRRMVAETGVDWLSVAVGNVHGALTDGLRGQKKVEARLDMEHLKRIFDAVKVPLVLHGGTGIPKSQIASAVRNGIAKINIATAVRQPYEVNCGKSIEAAREAVYKAAYNVLTVELDMRDSAEVLMTQ